MPTNEPTTGNLLMNSDCPYNYQCKAVDCTGVYEDLPRREEGVITMSIWNPCEKCVTDRGLCDGCNRNPKYADYPHQSLFKAYNPTCPIGYTDCVCDPAYIKHHHPAWYKELYGDLTPEEAAKTSCNPDLEDDYCDDYDDEDK